MNGLSLQNRLRISKIASSLDKNALNGYAVLYLNVAKTKNNLLTLISVYLG